MDPIKRDAAIALTDLLRRNVDLLSQGEPEGSPVLIELDAARVEISELIDLVLSDIVDDTQLQERVEAIRSHIRAVKEQLRGSAKSAPT